MSLVGAARRAVLGIFVALKDFGGTAARSH